MSSRINPPPPAARNFPGTPPLKREVGGWVLAVSSGLFFVVARGAKKNERRNAETGGEKREEGEAESNARRGRETQKKIKK